MNYSIQNNNIRRWALGLLLPYSAVLFSYPYLSLDWLLRVCFWEPATWHEDIWVHPEAVISLTTRWFFFGVWLPVVLFGLWCLFSGGRLLWLLQKGVVFDARVAQLLMSLGSGLIANALCTMLAGSLSPMIRSWHNPEGALPLRFWYTTELGGLILCGLAFLMVAAIMRESIRISRENEGFI